MKAITDFVKIMELKRYSRNTIVSYKNHLLMVKTHFNSKPFHKITDKELFEFIYHFVQIKKISQSYQRQIIGGLKLFYKEIYQRNIPFEYLKVTRRERKLPVILSKKEVKNIINAIDNIKHKSIIALLYSSGLRIGELLNLKKNDVDSDRMLIHVKSGKGKRLTINSFILAGIGLNKVRHK